ncbi:MAG: hypothetical protein AVDCRST_MAG15-2445 [uncultured Rubellimicrobium sp.]|uniref:Uncharacterized protein n=1 Tax=uncultured Rubellimicrobium sp. TaxID=543078 RepID=A0A6J4PVX2_9RHOB|nr:MAG: hypothetical protein AVDCRST_MAG15-2445 [uncultured Rubellimicrobium sp.]
MKYAKPPNLSQAMTWAGRIMSELAIRVCFYSIRPSSSTRLPIKRNSSCFSGLAVKRRIGPSAPQWQGRCHGQGCWPV